MMIRCGIYLVVVLLMITCQKTHDEESPKMKERKAGLQQAVVDSFRIMPAADEGWEVALFGLLPSPAYTLDHVQVKKSERSIDITPWMQYDPNKIVIMVAIPFQETISIGKVERDMLVKIHDAKQTRSRMIRLDEQ